MPKWIVLSDAGAYGLSKYKMSIQHDNVALRMTFRKCRKCLCFVSLTSSLWNRRSPIKSFETNNRNGFWFSKPFMVTRKLSKTIRENHLIKLHQHPDYGTPLLLRSFGWVKCKLHIFHHIQMMRFVCERFKLALGSTNSKYALNNAHMISGTCVCVCVYVREWMHIIAVFVTWQQMISVNRLKLSSSNFQSVCQPLSFKSYLRILPHFHF